MAANPLSERIGTLEEWIRGHEILCAERYGTLHDTVKWLVRGIFGMLIGIVAWLAIQLWNGVEARTAVNEARFAALTAAAKADARAPVTVIQAQPPVPQPGAQP